MGAIIRMVVFVVAVYWVSSFAPTRADVRAGQRSVKHAHKRAGSLRFEAKARELEAKEVGPGATFSKSKQVEWHLAKGRELWDDRDKAGAYAQWREVLRLDPGNSEAMASIRGAMVDEARKALNRFAQARGVTAVAESLDDETDDLIAQRLLVTFRNAIQKVDGSAQNSPDFALYDDFENFIDNHGLGRLVASAEMGRTVDYYDGRVYGRKFLEALAPWIQRIEESGIYVTMIPPFNSQNSADHLEQCRFTVQPSGAVYIEGPNVGPDVPLNAVWQDGEYRIAPRPGYRLIYQYQTKIKMRKWRRS